MNTSIPPRRGLLAGGNWLIDLIKIIDHYPAQDSLASVISQSLGNGGGPYNVLKDLRKMGVEYPLEAAGLVGDDAYGRMIGEECRELGIDARQLRITREVPTAYTDVMTVAGTGRRTFFHNRGANALLDEGHFDFSATSAKIFYIGYLLLLDRLDALDAAGESGAAKVLRRARAAGLATAVDLVSVPHPRAREILASAWPHIDGLFLNEYEAGNVLGQALDEKQPDAPERFAEAAGWFLRQGVKRWVAIHCPRFVVAVEASGAVWKQASVAVPPERIAGTVGAGDACAAGILHGCHEGWPLADCLRLGVCTAASCLFHPTASGGLLPWPECLALGERYGFRQL